MSTVLVLTSSALGDASVSNQLVDGTIARLLAHDPAAAVISRDLESSPVPHLGFDSTAVLSGDEPANDSQAAALALSDELVDELIRADTIVIGAPMYNFGITSTLKAWFDHVLRAGITFRYNEDGPEGLLKGKSAIVVMTRGGLYGEGAARAMDSQEPHLRTLLQFVGITDITFIRAEGLAFGADVREQAIETARGEIAQTVSNLCLQAA